MSKLPGFVFAAPLRNPSVGKDDIVAITRTEDEQSRIWSLTAYRIHEGKPVRVVETQQV